jgi:hypothetical protein
MQVSYSSHSEILECEQKWKFHKIDHIEPDPDATVDTFSFKFGKAHHSIVEWCGQELGYFEDKCDEFLHKAMQEQGLPADHDTECAIASTAYATMLLWKQTGLVTKRCELKIEDETLIGYIDFIPLDLDTGNWWIGDWKTTGAPQDIGPRLSRDPQLSLYRSFVPQVAKEMGLDPAKFQGCLYFEVVKPKLVTRANEKPLAYAKRCTAEARLFVIPDAAMGHEPVAVHAFVRQRAIEIANGRVPIRNYKACTNWNRKCEYWSRCYGGTVTACAEVAMENIMYLKRCAQPKGTKRADVVDANVEICAYKLTGSDPVPVEATVQQEEEIANYF